MRSFNNCGNTNMNITNPTNPTQPPLKNSILHDNVSYLKDSHFKLDNDTHDVLLKRGLNNSQILELYKTNTCLGLKYIPKNLDLNNNKKYAHLTLLAIIYRNNLLSVQDKIDYNNTVNQESTKDEIRQYYRDQRFLNFFYPDLCTLENEYKQRLECARDKFVFAQTGAN